MIRYKLKVNTVCIIVLLYLFIGESCKTDMVYCYVVVEVGEGVSGYTIKA